MNRIDLHNTIQAQARSLIDLAAQHGVVLTIEHRRTPDAKPASYIVDTRDTRAVYGPQLGCKHEEERQQYLGDGTPVLFCPECGRNKINGRVPYLSVEA